MSETPKIRDLAMVIEPHLKGGQLLSYSSRYLTKPGDNYGSVMLAIIANIKQSNGIIEELSLVAKLPPVSNDFYWEIFQPEHTCIAENAIYKYLVPALQNLQVEAGITEEQLYDGFSLYYGSRISLDPKAIKLDRDAILVQENLQILGFKAGNRLQMFDFAQTKIALEHAAQFHALSIALRLLKPHIFEAHVRPYFHKFNLNKGFASGVAEQIRVDILKEIELAINNNDVDIARIKECFDWHDKFWDAPEPKDSIFTTIVHFDLWINNLMIKYDEAGAPGKLKIIDFQIAQLGSLAHDVVFLLFSSVDSDILEEHFYDFLKIYLNAFLDCLEKVGATTAEYSFDIFLDEINRIAVIEIVHALLMSKIILADNSTLPDDYKDMNFSVIIKNSGVVRILKRIADIIRISKKFKFILN